MVVMMMMVIMMTMVAMITILVVMMMMTTMVMTTADDADNDGDDDDDINPCFQLISQRAAVLLLLRIAAHDSADGQADSRGAVGSRDRNPGHKDGKKRNAPGIAESKSRNSE